MDKEKTLLLCTKLGRLAGGVGVAAMTLAGGSAAYASVITWDGSGSPWDLTAPINITSDGTGAGTILAQFYEYLSGNNHVLYAYYPTPGNTYYNRFANVGGNISVFTAGQMIDATDFGSSVAGALGAFYDGVNNQFYIGPDPEYAGFRFDNSGTTNYGWMLVEWNVGQHFDVLAWGYDDTGAGIEVPNPIPEPGTLALLALGAPALAVARRRRQQKAS